MTDNFRSVAGPLIAASDALSYPPVEEEDADEVYAVITAENPRHWDEKELLATQKEDHQTLAAAERLASTPDFSWPEKKGMPVAYL